MRQTRVDSALEATFNVVGRIATIAILNQWVFPAFGIDVRPARVWNIAGLMLVIVWLRSYFIRRFFTRLEQRN